MATHDQRKKCQDFLKARALQPDQVDSLYYGLLRKIIRVNPQMLKIESIERATVLSDHEEYSDYKITLSIGNTVQQLLLVHPERRDVALEEGLVKIVAVKVPISIQALRNNRRLLTPTPY